MKIRKSLVIVFSLVLLFSCCSVAAKSVPANASPMVAAPDAPDRSKVLAARFLNMLNHNYAYDDDYRTEEALVNAAALSLRNYADAQGFIPADLTAAYVKNFYGVAVEDFSVINTAFEQREGYVYLIPRGFKVYQHTFVSLSLNEDGTYTVVTRVREADRDGAAFSATVETLFVPDAQSEFGYHIVRSVFRENYTSL